MEACHRCFEPLQRLQRTPLERLFLSKVLVCSTCNRKTRFLHDGALRFLGRIEWLLNVYTSCAHCGFAYVTRVAPSDADASDTSSRWAALSQALHPPTYRCERCESSYGDFRPARYPQPQKPAVPRPARVVRVADVMNPEGSIDISSPAQEPALSLGFDASMLDAPPLVQAAETDDVLPLTVPWETAPSPRSPAIIDIAPAPAARSAMDDFVTHDDELVALANGASIESSPYEAVAFITIDVVPPVIPEVHPVEAAAPRASVNREPSLDVIRTLPQLDLQSTEPPAVAAAAAAEQAARAAAECAKLEALLAAFERHGKTRPRSLAPASRPSLPTGPQVPLPASVKSPASVLAN